MTTDARSVLQGLRLPATAGRRDRLTPPDLAAALTVPVGNIASLWPDSPAASARPSSARWGRFDVGLQRVVEESVQVALRHGAGHVGTEHLLAALVRTGPADVVARLAERGATVEAVDALLARLDGGPGVERLPDPPTPAQERRWRRATARASGGRRQTSPYVTLLVATVVAAVLFVLCVWGP